MVDFQQQNNQSVIDKCKYMDRCCTLAMILRLKFMLVVKFSVQNSIQQSNTT